MQHKGSEILSKASRITGMTLTQVSSGAIDFLGRYKLARDVAGEFCNTGIGYLAGLITYNQLSKYLEVRSFKNLWGLANFKRKTMVNEDTFEMYSFIISAIVGFIMLKVVSYFAGKLWEKVEKKTQEAKTIL